MFFQSRFLDLLSLICFRFFSKTIVWGTPSKSDGCQNGAQNRPSGAKNRKTLNCAEAPFRPWFSRNQSNYCTVGTSWLLKGHLFDGDWLICCFGCVSLCYVLYNMFIIYFFHKTSVNAQPLSPPCFEEIAARKKKTILICVFAFAFVQFLIFLLIFGYPLPTPWTRLAQFWIDVGTIVGPTFPRFSPPALDSCRDLARNFARNLQRTCRELARNVQEMQRTFRELARNL